MQNLQERLPFFAKGKTATATDIVLLSSTKLQPVELKLTRGTEVYDFVTGVQIGGYHSLVIQDGEIPLSDWVVQIDNVQKVFEKAWLVVRYVLA